MIKLRPAKERGESKLDWLDSKHTFSFSDYYDDEHMHFSYLRVINEDIVAPGKGFGAHSHKDMEIITYVIEGSVAHKDSMGTDQIIHAGEVQRMTAGTGVTHSEFNPSKTTPLHLLQIWILPEQRNLAPGYEQKKLELVANDWVMVADRNGGNGCLSIHQDVGLLSARITAGSKLPYRLQRGSAWLQVVKGSIAITNIKAQAGDGLAITGETGFDMVADQDSEVLLFDLPRE
jgi:redox-sensitive bicupin YhaK (pirin superfamily)